MILHGHRVCGQIFPNLLDVMQSLNQRVHSNWKSRRRDHDSKGMTYSLFYQNFYFNFSSQNSY